MNELDIETYMKEYLRDCRLRRHLSEKTLRAYRNDLSQFDDFIDRQYLNYDRLKEYVFYLNEHYHSVRTIKRKLASIKAFYHYLEREEIIAFSPFRKVRTILKEHKDLPRTIPQGDLQKIYSHVHALKDEYGKNHNKMAIQKAVILCLLFSTGMRVSELCSIKKENIDLLTCVIKVNGKGSKQRLLYIEEKVMMDMLKLYISAFKDEIEKAGYLLINQHGKKLNDSSVRLLLSLLEHKLQLSAHITPHMFRHTFATSLLDKDVDIRYIQKFLGHSSITTTQIYTHVSLRKQKEILGCKNPLSDFF